MERRHGYSDPLVWNWMGLDSILEIQPGGASWCRSKVAATHLRSRLCQKLISLGVRKDGAEFKLGM